MAVSTSSIASCPPGLELEGSLLLSQTESLPISSRLLGTLCLSILNLPDLPLFLTPGRCSQHLVTKDAPLPFAFHLTLSSLLSVHSLNALTSLKTKSLLWPWISSSGYSLFSQPNLLLFLSFLSSFFFLKPKCYLLIYNEKRCAVTWTEICVYLETAHCLPVGRGIMIRELSGEIRYREWSLV